MSAIPKELFRHIRRIQIRSTHLVNDVFAGAYHSAFKGMGMEFEDVREYTPGDDVRSIDWNVTARLNHPYVKSYREERELTVILAVDVSASEHFGSSSRLKSETIAEIAAVLALSAITNNDKVGLILFSSKIEKYLPPKKGLRHVLRVIRELLAFEPEEAGTDVAAALEFLVKVHRKRGVVFLMSDFISSDYSTAMALASKRHELVTVAVTDPYELKFPDLGLVCIQDLEAGTTAVVDTSRKETRDLLLEHSQERINRHKALAAKVGAGFINLSSDSDYVTALRKFFKKRESRR